MTLAPRLVAVFDSLTYSTLGNHVRPGHCERADS